MSEKEVDVIKEKEPNVLTNEVIINSWDQNCHIWFRNMRGSSFDIRDFIRELAEKAALEKSDLEILEVTSGIPVKSLQIGGDDFRRHGDMLVYGTSSHEVPNIKTTIVSEIDWTKLLLKNQSPILEKNTKDICKSFIFPSLDNFREVSGYSLESRKKFLKIYEDKIKEGKIKTTEGDNSLESLGNLYEEGKHFDLVFLDHQSCPDKLAYFQAIQRVLSAGGQAYLPIDWWTPNTLDTHDGLTETILWSEEIKTEHGSEDLVDYLVREFPDAFEIANFPGAKTLIIKGTTEPVELVKKVASNEEPLRDRGGFGFGSIDASFHEFDPENKLGLFSSIINFSKISLSLSKHPHPHDELKKIIKELLSNRDLSLDSILGRY